MSSPATVRYPLRDIKLLSINDSEQKCSYWMYPLINRGAVRIADIVHHFKPGCSIPADPIYWQVYRRCKALARLGYVKLEKRSHIDWKRTQEARDAALQNRVQSIFAAVVRKDTPPSVSTGTLTGEPNCQISTVKVQENGLYVVPTENLFALISRMQNSNQFLKGAKSRREMQDARENSGFEIAKLKMQRKRHCPYYVSVRTRKDRMDAIFKLRGIRRHGMFKRRDKAQVNPELTREIDTVQTSFERYMETVEGLQITLQEKATGAIKFIDYQTRFTDRTRQDSTIARYHRVWEKAGEGFNTGVMLTLTSYPPSEAPKHQHRNSLWHVDRHFGSAWNAYMSKLAKRNRAARRDELLDLKREEVRKIRPVTLKKERCWRCEGTGKLKGITKKNPVRECPRCHGEGSILKVILTKEERKEALLPMSKKWLCDQALEKICKLKPDRIELTEEERRQAEAPANFRPQYLQVYEFQKNGLLHGHAVIFGKTYLAYWEDIALDWMQTGQGERIHVYGIQRQGDRWVWLKEQPRDSRNRQPVDYLGKYLGKGVRVRSGHGLYWSVNKRFFTNSRALDEDRELPEAFEKVSSYEFIGTTRNEEIPTWLLSLHRGRARAVIGMSDPLGWDSGGGGALA